MSVRRPRKPVLSHGFGMSAGTLPWERRRGLPLLLEWNQADVEFGQRWFFPIQRFVLVRGGLLGAGLGSDVPIRGRARQMVMG